MKRNDNSQLTEEEIKQLDGLVLSGPTLPTSGGVWLATVLVIMIAAAIAAIVAHGVMF